VDGVYIMIGSRKFVTGSRAATADTRVYVRINEDYPGYFSISGHYRSGIATWMLALKKRYSLSLLSGDNDRERRRLEGWIGEGSHIQFFQSPEGKEAYVRHLQRRGEKVMMVGDGLNDAGALRQSDTGIAVTEMGNSFTPASHAILDGAQIHKMPVFLSYCRKAGNIVIASFVVSIVYNIIGLSFAVRGDLSPLVAAILMPLSSLSILLLTYGSANWIAKKLGLVLSPLKEPII